MSQRRIRSVRPSAEGSVRACAHRARSWDERVYDRLLAICSFLTSFALLNLFLAQFASLANFAAFQHSLPSWWKTSICESHVSMNDELLFHAVSTHSACIVTAPSAGRVTPRPSMLHRAPSARFCQSQPLSLSLEVVVCITDSRFPQGPITASFWYIKNLTFPRA